jgi:hypothetical protein
MSDLGVTYIALGKYADALPMFERVLEFRRRELPENHPDIGEGHVWSYALHDVFLKMTYRFGHEPSRCDVR